MKCVLYSIAFLSILSLTLNSCTTNNQSKQSTLSIASTSITEQISVKQNLTFTFNENVIKEEEQGIWQNENLLMFEPFVKGNYRWINLNEIEFSPDYGFKPNTKYKVVLSEALIKNTDFKLDENYQANFATTKLQIKDGTAAWQLADADKNQSELSVKVNFNFEVSPTSFKNITATINGKNYTTEIVNNVSAKHLDLRIPANQNIEPDQSIELVIAAPYKVYNSENNDNIELSTSIKIPKPGELIISGHTVEHNGTLGEIYINTNQKLKEANLKEYISISPEIEFNIDNQANGFRIFSNDFEVSSSYSFTIKEGLKGVLSNGLENEYTAQFSFGHIEPNIKFISNKNRYLSSAGSKNIAVEIINIDEVDVKITKVFANNIKALFNRGKDHRYDRSYNDETDRWDYRNYQIYNTAEYGKLIYEKKINTKDLETVGKMRLLNLNFEDILDNYNGIYIVEVSHPEKRYLTSSQIVSLSDVGIISKVGKDAIYVFLNSIKTTQPIAGATVTLFDQTNQKLTSRPSDGEGVVKFALNEINMIEPNIKLIEVKTTTDFNFLSFQQSQMNSSRLVCEIIKVITWLICMVKENCIDRAKRLI